MQSRTWSSLGEPTVPYFSSSTRIDPLVIIELLNLVQLTESSYPAISLDLLHARATMNLSRAIRLTMIRLYC